VGYLGLGTRAKGFDLYLRLARKLAPALDGVVAFHAIGNLHRELAHEDQSVLAQPLAKAPIPRQDFVQAAAGLHYVVLPYQGNYYEWSGSGTLVDAISLGKPIIATDFPFVKALFDRFGDVGFLCEDEAGLVTAFRQLPVAFEKRYDQQKRALSKARQNRSLAAGIVAYRKAIEIGFPGVLNCHSRPEIVRK
jgi:glycosyltransferase involved in cell wall biosynthesis